MTKSVIRQRIYDYLPGIIFLGIISVAVLIVVVASYIQAESYVHLIDSFSCEEFKDYIIYGKSKIAWINELYVERCGGALDD